MSNYDKGGDSKSNSKPKGKRRGGRGGMFGGRRGGYGGGGNPITKLLYGIISAIIVFFLLYLFYTLVVTGDKVPDSAIINVFINVVEWGIGIAKGIGSFIIDMFSGGGPSPVAPGEGIEGSGAPNA